MSDFCPMITQCGQCDPCCSERIKMNTMKKIQKDWWRDGENCRAAIRDIEGTENHK